MNKEQLQSLFQKLGATTVHLNDDVVVSEVTTNLQKAVNHTIVFYRCFNNDTAIQAFEERMVERKDLVVVTNFIPPFMQKRNNVVTLPYDQFKNAQDEILKSIYPISKMPKLVGITGTNGKTTVTNIGMQISSLLGKRAIALGTIGIVDHNGNVLESLEATTPSYVELYKTISKYQDQVDAIFLEVSSHALVQGRLGDFRLDIAGWTSFSQDHLDYHNTMEEYFDAKKLVFQKYLLPTSKCFIPESNKELKPLLDEDAVSCAPRLKERQVTDLPLFFKTSFNASNLELALAINETIWEANVDKLDLYSIVQPKGRFSIIELGTSFAVIDYAHTPDALENVCSEIKRSFPDHVLKVVFGCGGDRDRTKRPLMAKAVERFADEIYVTSDNPRSENPESIIDDIVAGIDKKEFKRIEKRDEAIEKAIASISLPSIILIAGKGHEEYQEINGVKYEFSDFDVVNSIAEKLSV